MYDYDDEYEIGYQDDYKDFEDACAYDDMIGDFEYDETFDDCNYSDYCGSEDFD